MWTGGTRMAEYCTKHVVCRGHYRCLPWYKRWWTGLTEQLPLSWFLLVLLTVLPVQAQATVIEFNLMPPGHFGKVQDVGPARYYLLEEYIELAKFDAELVKLRQDIQGYRRIERQLTEQIAAKEKIIESLEADKLLLTNRGLRLEESWKKCEEDLLDASSPPIWPYVVGAVGTIVGAVGLGVYIGTR